MVQQAMFAYSPLGISLEKQTKTIKDQGESQARVKNIQNN